MCQLDEPIHRILIKLVTGVVIGIVLVECRVQTGANATCLSSPSFLYAYSPSAIVAGRHLVPEMPACQVIETPLRQNASLKLPPQHDLRKGHCEPLRILVHDHAHHLAMCDADDLVPGAQTASSTVPSARAWHG